ncbi:hypothetical protein F4777DRAFT_153280 [Nemania sp. FL0916]|nr:hypothetical protein F4777DRAFT_153280 [Nemania sp. FL0916]
MNTSTYEYTRSVYGTRLSTSTSEQTGSAEQDLEHPDHYDLFLLIQDMLRSDKNMILEFPIDEVDSHAVGIGLGAGGFASVSRKIANRRWGDRSVMAYKRIRPSFDFDGKIDKRAALRQVIDELKILSAPSIRSHPNICRLRGISFEIQDQMDGRLFPALILDPSPFGSLLDFIRDPIRMIDGPYWECCVDVGRGLQALHKNQFIHGDVKCENVLIFPATNYERRNFIAKLTDFGCSMNLDTIEPNTYTRLKGSTPLYDAPEANGMIHRDNLVYTDVYSYGILIWKVTIDGADPFNHSPYRHSATDDGNTPYNHALIRQDKSNDNLLSIALNEMHDTALGLPLSTADSFCEVLSIALSADPTQRNLDHVMEAFERNREHFQRRTFGLTTSGGQLVRDFTKHNIKTMQQISRSRYGLAEWESIPPKAHHLYHIVHKYGKLDSRFRGFGPSRLPPPCEGLRDVLSAIENVYSFCGQTAPLIGSLQVSSGSGTNEEEIMNQTTEIITAAIKNALEALRGHLARTTNSLARRTAARSIANALTDALKAFASIAHSMATLFESSAGMAPSRPGSVSADRTRHIQGLYDRPGGLAATDVAIMTEEKTPSSPTFIDHEPSTHLDFHLLSTCRLPFTLQEQLFTDVSCRAKRSANYSMGILAAMEEAVCYILGFGVKQDHTKYLSIIQECCMRNYTPGQTFLQRLYDALGVSPPQELLSSEWYSAQTAVSTPSEATKAIMSLLLASHDNIFSHDTLRRDSLIWIKDVRSTKPHLIDARDRYGNTPLILAFRAGSISIANFLIDNCMDCAATNDLGESAIHWLWTFDPASLPNINRMTRRRVDLNVTTKENPLLGPYTPCPLVRGTALHRAIAQGNKEAVQALIRSGASVVQDGGSVFFHRGQCSSFDPIQLACTWHEAEILELLLDSAPFYPINARDNVGLLYFAIQCQSTHHRMARYGSNIYRRIQETINLLIRRGCSSIVDKDGLTALQLAVTSDSPEILEYILFNDFFLGDMDKTVEGKSVLHWAISRGTPTTFEILVMNGVDVISTTTLGPTLLFATRFAGGNDYFVKRIFELGGDSVTQTDKNKALGAALREKQWELADFLFENGADINGLTDLINGMAEHTVFGYILQIDNVWKLIEVFERTISLAAKHNQKPQFLVCPTMDDSALHATSGQIFTHQKHQATRLYTMLLSMFPGKLHLEARNRKGWTPLHSAIYTRNAVMVEALLRAGADANSMALIEGSPVGPSCKDIVFAELFSRAGAYELSSDARNDADRALEQIFKILIFNNKNEEGEEKGRISSSPAKRSVTLRAEQRQRGHMSPRDRRVANFVDVLSLLAQQLPRNTTSLEQEAMKAVATGEWEGMLQTLMPRLLENSAKNVQWTGLEKVRFLRQEGAGILRKMGLLDDYLDD